MVELFIIVFCFRRVEEILPFFFCFINIFVYIAYCNNKTIIMEDLITYKNLRIKTLQNRVNTLEQENLQLESYLFELLTGDCSEDYKNEIKTKLFTQDERIS